jgi:DHA1 family bicyclomycin/chloramphenicol resistance-like MFS transporter
VEAPAKVPAAATVPRAPASGLPRRTSLPLGFVALLAALSTISPFATDTYLPSLPAVAESLHASPLEVQQTLSAYMLGLGLMALWHGSISDALGRRPVALAALAVFTLASLGCAIARSIEILIVLRFVQGLSGGAGMVVARAAVRDSVEGVPAQRLMSHITLMFGIAPAIAPIIGGWLHEWFGWRSVFWFMFAFGAALTVWTQMRLPETLDAAQRQSLHPFALARAYWQVFKSPRFHALAATTAFSFQVFLQYIGASTAFLRQQLGLKDTQYAFFFMPAVFGFMLGAWLSGRLAGRWQPTRTVALGLALMVGAALTNVVWHAFFPPGVVVSIAPIFVATVGLALISPITQLMVLEMFPRTRGLAASCQVFTQIMVGTVDLAIISIALAGSTFTLALGLLGWVTAATLAWCAYLALTRHILRRVE